jgi:hypothetical protein
MKDVSFSRLRSQTETFDLHQPYPTIFLISYYKFLRFVLLILVCAF